MNIKQKEYTHTKAFKLKSVNDNVFKSFQSI